MDYQESLTYIERLGHEFLAMRPGLERITSILGRLDNPHKAYPSVIVAGTNGKGSVAVMIEAILRSARVRVGLFTSPHLIRPEERIRLDGRPISQEGFAAAASLVANAVEELHEQKKITSRPSFFEFLAAMAFEYFRSEQSDVAVLEVGLGGRLDATNVAPAFLTVITSIDYDHEKHLGTTLEAIAGEKAATIKPGCRAVVAVLQPEVVEVMTQHARTTGTEPTWIAPAGPCRVIERQVDRDGHRMVDLITTEGRLEGVLVGLRGSHQSLNAITATEACLELRRLGSDVAEVDIREGLSSVRWPGRLELLLPGKGGSSYQERPHIGSFFGGHCLFESRDLPDISVRGPRQAEGCPRAAPGPAILLDGAHNPAAARVLRAALEEIRPRHVTLIFGAMRDKKIEGMAKEIFPSTTLRILTRVEDARAADLVTLRSVAEEFGPFSWADRPQEALKLAVESTPGDGLVCVTGSLYLVGAVKKILQEQSSGGLAGEFAKGSSLS